MGLISNLLLLAVIVAILLGAFEIAIRIFMPQTLEKTVPGLYEISDKLGHRMTANYNQSYSRVEYTSLVQTNSMGFRDREYAEKNEGTLRVLVLGDSFLVSMGVEYEEMFTTRLEEMLNKDPGRHKEIQVINGSTDGYSPYQYLLLLKEKNHEIKPDIVLVAFYVGNDFYPRKILNDNVQTSTLSDKSIDFSFKRDIVMPLNTLLESHSHAFLFLRVRLDNLLWKLGLRPYEFHNVFKKKWSPTISEYWTDTRQILQEIRDFSNDELGAEFGVVVIPTIYQVYEKFWEHNLEFFSVSADVVDKNKPNRVLSEFLTEENIKHFDLLDGFLARPADPLLYYPIDRHWNKDGNQLAAELVYSFIKDEYQN